MSPSCKKTLIFAMLLKRILYKIDLDECSTGKDQCEDQCHNTWGSYSCACTHIGRKLSDDGHHCEGSL